MTKGMCTPGTIGTCGNCGGAVTVPTVWYGIQNPTPTCQSCGATPVQTHGPLIPMNKPREEQK